MACFSWRCLNCGFSNAEITNDVDDGNGYVNCSYCRARHKIDYKLIIKKVEWVDDEFYTE